MNTIGDALAFILNAANWSGSNGIGERLGQHVVYTMTSVVIAAVIAIPLGLLIGHTGHGRTLIITVTGAARALPTFGLLLLVVLVFGIHLAPVIGVLTVLGIPPLLAGTYAGIEAVDQASIDGARSTGFSEWQIVSQVELPIALPVLVGGIRASMLQVIATTAIAGYVAQGGLGRYLIEGLARRQYDIAVVGALLIALLAVITDAVLAILQTLSSPGGTRHAIALHTQHTPPSLRR